MRIGLKSGDQGQDVAELQRVLTSNGFQIERAEIDRQEFGPATLQALHALQRIRGLPERDDISEDILAILVESRNRITVNVYENAPPAKSSAPDPRHGRVRGMLVDEDGAPLAGRKVALFAQHVRSAMHLGDGQTDQRGQYRIDYSRPSALNLVMHAYDETGNDIAQSPTVFAAPVQAQINFTTAADGVVRKPSAYTALVTAIAPQLGDIPLSSLREDKDSHELTFLANAIGAPFTDVAYLYIAQVLGAKHGIKDTTFFGFFYEGIPASLDTALDSLPDAGIDATFCGQVLTGILQHSHVTLSMALSDATTTNLIPASYAAVENAQLALLDGLRTQTVGTVPYIRGKTSLNDLLAAGSVSSAVQTAFTQAYAANNGLLGPTWKTLRANKALPAADLTVLETTLSLGELLTGNLPLIKDTLARLSAKSLAGISSLALLDQSDWMARITEVDANATSLPVVVPGETAQDRIGRFAKTLVARFGSRYSTMAFAGGLMKSASSVFANTKTELANFIVANPTFNFKRTNLDQYLVANQATLSVDALADIKKAQRLFKVSPHYATVEALANAGHTSAQSVYFVGRDTFIAAMATPFGSESLAKMAYARAQVTYATVLMAFARFNSAFNRVGFSAMGTSTPPPASLTNLPDMQALFGSLDYFQCEDCQSIYSPAAYLVDLLQYLSGFSASGGGVTNARDAFLLRRPDVQYLALDCNNTNTRIPYIDLVNELLEAQIAPPVPAVTVIDTTGTSAERQALPQQISTAAYILTAAAVFPLGLPFDLYFSQTTQYLAALGVPWASILALFGGSPVTVATASAMAGAGFGINPAMQKVITGTDGNTEWARWGLAQNPVNVIDPNYGTPYGTLNSSGVTLPAPADWVAALNYVPVLLNRSGLSLQQLYQLLEVVWVTQAGVTLSVGTATVAGLSVLSADTDAMKFTGLTDAVLDRANRFLRLWAATGLQMWEIDWALEESPGGVMDDAFLVFLSGAVAVKDQLSLPLQEVLGFWMPLETRDVTNHLGDEDTVQPSTYTEVFRNPAVLASAANIFVPVGESTVTGASNASPIVMTTAEPHGYQTNQQVAITGVLGNLAANGTFTITVDTATTFTLIGTTGSGAWTSGGTATGVLSGNPILATPPAPPTAEESAVTAALGLSGDEISAILTSAGAANTLTLGTLGALLQYQRLATSLSLQVTDLILWIQLSEQQPFNGTPANTVEFCRRLALLQGTSLQNHDLDYLLRNQSASQSSLAVTSSQVTTVLQAIGTALAKLPTPQTFPVSGASGATPIAITTSAASGLQTGASLTIAGVLGNTAANGTFTITATGATSFTLDGTAGNGAYAGGGTITLSSYTPATIEPIVVSALAAATTASATVVTELLLRTGVLPLDSATIQSLIAQSSTVDASQFPLLANAITSVAKGAALCMALSATDSAFTFVLQNATTFGWLDAGALPLAATSDSQYLKFQSLLWALQLDQRQPARSPKLFDVLTQWLIPGALPGTVATAINPPTITVAGASNATPIVITSTAAHGLATGMEVAVSGVQGNTAANGTFTVTVISAVTFSLDGSVGNGAYTAGGSVSQPGLAAALNASVDDLQAIATALAATSPGITPALLAGSLADVNMLQAIATALNLTAQYGVSGASLVELAVIPVNAASVTAAMGALQAQYTQSTWFAAITPVENILRQSRRDALVAYMLGPGPAAPVPAMLTANDIYNYYLIDPEMQPCALMTRLLQAALAIQQFVQQCFLNLSFSDVTVNMTSPNWSEWSWRQQYRLWQANREVFLYPENYLLPDLRPDASPFFTDLESDTSQGNCDEQLSESALGNYLRKLLGVARLHIAAHYNQVSNGTYTLYVFAHTHAHPAQWYYRTRTGQTADTGSWSAWLPLNLDIASQHVLPVVWDQRLYLVWPVFKQISEQQSNQSVPAGGGGTQAAPQKFWSVEFCISEFSAGQWQPKQSIYEKAYFNTPDSPLAFTLRAWQDSKFNLLVNVYFVGVEEAIEQATLTALSTEDIENAEGAVLNLLSEFGFGFGENASTVEKNQTFTGSWLGSTASVSLNWQNGNPNISTTAANGVSQLVMQATLPMPESPLQVVETPQILPGGQYIDLTQDPTYALVKTQTLSGQLATPANYGFAGQDLVYGNYTLNNPGTQVLNVLCSTTKNGPPVSLELLGTIFNPRIVVPPQETVFDSADPFFVADSTRTYLVQPTYWTISSNAQEITDLTYTTQWGTRFSFETFYHPYARTFLREFEIGGVSQLMARSLQVNPQAVRGWTPNFNFQSIYDPQPPVAKPYPGVAGAPDPGETYLDFAVGDSGAYSLYNWEVFYQIPMFISSQLLQNQQWQQALDWLQYIFNPTDTSGGATPQRYWQMAPLNAMNASSWASQNIQTLLTLLAADTQQGINDSATATAIQNWMNDPYDPQAVASLRISAYGKATVMQFINVLMAWGDWYYSGTQYTAENVSQAEQLYVYADMLLGPEPQMLRSPSTNQSGAAAVTYASLKNIDLFSNALVNVENIIVAPEPPQALVQGTNALPSLPLLPGNGNSLLFCIPPNEQMLAYWPEIAQRLYNIRNCLNLQGQPQPLALYPPPINPLALIEAAESGASFSSATPTAPIYRFQTYIQKAVQVTGDVRSYAALILPALEKQDADALALLQANQELNVQTMMLDVTTEQVTAAQDQITALQNQQAVVQVRQTYYTQMIAAGLNPYETVALTLQAAALMASGQAVALDMTAGEMQLIPSFSFGIAGFGGSPNVSASFGGGNLAGAVSAMAAVIRDQTSQMTQNATMVNAMGTYARRANDWTLQLNLANAEYAQLTSQITVAQDQLAVAQKQLALQNTRINNAQAVSTFLTNKFTNAQLYSWMVTQLTTVYTQAYQLALSLAVQAQNAYNYELGNQDTFIQFGYWNSQYKGLTAGESLLFDLRRMEAQYLSENSRELELTKHISLALTNPTALVMLRETGACQIALDETLFEFDHPGQYFRRLRSVALTIPCVTGPYTGVNATLTLTGALVRTQAPGTTYQPQSATTAPNDGSVLASPIAAAGTQTIATSSGQNDAGLFEVNLRDERWLPFEGQGAISTWNLVLDPRDNNFDFTTITDVVMHVRYTARGGGDLAAAAKVRAQLKPTMPRWILVSSRYTFPDAYYAFFNPAPALTSETLSLALSNAVFPYTNLGNSTAEIANITFYVILAVPAAGNNFSAAFTGTGVSEAVSFAPMAGSTSAGTAIQALTATVALAPALAAPQTFSLSVNTAGLPAQLTTTVAGQTVLDPAKIVDILMVIQYAIG